MSSLVSKRIRIGISGCLLLLIFSCSTRKTDIQDSAPIGKIDLSNAKPVVVTSLEKSRYGNPSSYEVRGRTYQVKKSAKNYKKEGVASWYGTKFHGRRTSSGEIYDMLALTAAHKTLPIPCFVKVTNLENGKYLIVRVNDRGPFVKDRIIDLSYAAAHKMGMTEKGTAKVRVESVTVTKDNSRNSTKLSKKRSKEVSSNHDWLESKHKGEKRFVQVGAYSVYKSAQKLAKVLDKEIDLPVKISKIKRKGSTLYRVRIGPIDSLKIAESLANTLNIKELGKPRIVYED
ncbi:MAG: rare lipoprotein A [Polaribacter sp.]|jgi:rare lipoprotein A